MTKTITLSGAGLTGSLLAIYLAKQGFNVEIFESRLDMRKESISAGRSINLALSVRGIHALQEVGLLDEIMTLAIPMKGRQIHDIHGKQIFSSYGKAENEVIYSVSRKLLNCKLMDLAEATGKVKIHFSHRVLQADLEHSMVEIYNQAGNQTFSKKIEICIGTDGGPSAIRNSFLKLPRFNFSQNYLEHGYKELTMEPNELGDFRMEPNALHIWPRGTFMLIALPNVDKTFTCTLFHPYSGEEGLNQLNNAEKIQKFFQKYFPDAFSFMPDVVEQYLNNPVGHLATIRCAPWHYNNFALLGDSAHAVVPFYGQGMNCGFEDCSEFNACLKNFSGDWTKIFQEYEKNRIKNANAIADLALENFIEMRDKVADIKFLLRKKVELQLETWFPERYITKYGMVSFHRMPYAEAQLLGKQQDLLLDELCENLTDLSQLNQNQADILIQKYLES